MLNARNLDLRTEDMETRGAGFQHPLLDIHDHIKNIFFGKRREEENAEVPCSTHFTQRSE